MLNRISPWFVVPLILVAASCDTSRDAQLLEPGTEVPAIQDARDTEYAGSGVYLLPPISDNQYTRTGPFDVEADPRVEICRLAVQGDLTVTSIQDAACDEVVAWFETDVSHDGTTFVQVTPSAGAPAASDSMFSVNWNTDPQDAGFAFRASILVPGLSVGDGGVISVQYDTAAQFDALLYENSSNQLDPDLIVGTTAGQNFPIKFIVEESAGCDGLDCFAYRVTCETATYQTQHAGVSLPEDWASECDVNVPGPERSWWLFQERLPRGTHCIPSAMIDGIQYEPCYVWQLVEEDDGVNNATGFRPYQEQFAQPATVQFCYNEENDGGVPDDLIDLVGVYRYSQLPGGGTEVALSPEADENALSNFTCPYDGPLSNSSSGPLTAFTELVRPALRFLGLDPRPLFAGDKGTLSTKTVRMSEFQHVLPLNLSAEDISALLVGSSQEISVDVTTPPHHDPLDGPSAGVPNVEVRFEVLSGDAEITGGTACPDGAGGTIDNCVIVATSSDDNTTTTDEGGVATATLTAGTSGGTVVIRVTIPDDPDGQALELTVETVNLITVFLEPLDTGDFYGPPYEPFAPTVEIVCEAGPGCSSGDVVASLGPDQIKLVEENGRKFYQTGWKPRDYPVQIDATFTARVIVEGTTVGVSIPIVVTKGGKGERVGDVYYNGVNSSVPLKFSVTQVSP